MNILLHRFEFGSHYTIGRLFLDGVYQCYTLEDKVQSPKVPGETAIPAGEYKVIFDFSNRFQKEMPHILDVPGFEGIRIHAGNTDKDTEGCVLLGETWAGNDFIYRSQSAFGRVCAKLQAAFEGGEGISIKVE